MILHYLCSFHTIDTIPVQTGNSEKEIKTQVKKKDHKKNYLILNVCVFASSDSKKPKINVKRKWNARNGERDKVLKKGAAWYCHVQFSMCIILFHRFVCLFAIHFDLKITFLRFIKTFSTLSGGANFNR